MIIWPAIDLYGGKVVRLTRGEFSTRKDYAEDPIEVARRFLASGCRRLHIVDLEGAEKGEPVHDRLLPTLASLGITIRYGGGLRSPRVIERVIEAGASFVMVGSLLFSSPRMPEDLFGLFGDRVIPAVDVKRGLVSIKGWTEELPESPLGILEGLHSTGYVKCLVTSVDRDGTGLGPDLDLYSRIRKILPAMGITAAGGISRVEHLEALERIGLAGAVLGKGLYEGTVTIEQAMEVEGRCC